MTQKMIIEVETSKPLSSYGEGHVIVYNAQKRNYYVTSRDNLLAPQNAKIGELEKIVEAAEKQISRTKAAIDETVTELVKTFNEFKSSSAGDIDSRIAALNASFDTFRTSTRNEFDGTMSNNNSRFNSTVDNLSLMFAKAQSETHAEIAEFKAKIEAEQAEFYKTYKETNAKILELVKKTCIAAEEKTETTDSAGNITENTEGDNV